VVLDGPISVKVLQYPQTEKIAGRCVRALGRLGQRLPMPGRRPPAITLARRSQLRLRLPGRMARCICAESEPA